jgi:hypothetical protein
MAFDSATSAAPCTLQVAFHSGAHFGDECLNPVTELSAPLRVLVLDQGNRKPRCATGDRRQATGGWLLAAEGPLLVPSPVLGEIGYLR